ncbi:MAG: NHL repeat containing protein [candidate division Zixibacteria bacterium RBG-1]|nr:MAG: NHL repeat containing protein [candidate division Zixibacteria bacterium RBG-1]OGC86542.1 MAG: hypothetical protein A2V73_03520 [candidate division Zixibacteria bacterium RBG_19FT_COMBO_42_43]
MRIRIYFFFLFVFLSYIPVLAQVDTVWVRRYNGPGNGYDQANALAVDHIGNVYVTGFSDGSGLPAYGTIKYAPNGDTLWVRRFNGQGNSQAYARALAVDGSGNVYVTGQSYGGIGSSYDYATIKYAPNGDTLWVRRYNGPGNYDDYAFALALDSGGNVYVTGYSWDSATAFDYATIKYTPNGDTLWVRRYNGPANGSEVSTDLALDASGNVYVTGYSAVSGSDYDYATIKYAHNGDILWVRCYNGPGNNYDIAYDLAVDGSGNVYVTGFCNGGEAIDDYATIKYGPDGETLWVRLYNGPGNGQDIAYALAVDGSGNVYVTGFCSGGGAIDYATIKYGPDGETLWVRLYNGPGNGYDQANALAVDHIGNVYVTGFSEAWGTSHDYATIKYAPNGDILWVRRYSGPGNYDDYASALALDSSGNVYVTGESRASGSYWDYATIKYTQCLFGHSTIQSLAPVTVTENENLIFKIFVSPVCSGIPTLSALDPPPHSSFHDSGNGSGVFTFTPDYTQSGIYNVTFIACDTVACDSETVEITVLCGETKRGDPTGNGNINLADIIYLVNFIFKGGPAPIPEKCDGDANNDGKVNLADIIFLVNFVFKDAPAPVPPTCCQ